MARGFDEDIRASGVEMERGAPTREEIARYVADMAAQLSSMSREANLPLLGYFLDMAHMEARETVLRSTPQPSR